ncbi:MAG: ComF family protein [Candidatus Gastranaerophilales bacterium]|nr:ComF family protein [Candidatus Gastranaerophilales bacterium]
MFKGLLLKILDLIYKKKCIVCSCAKTDDLLCKNCAKDVNFLSGFPHKIYNSIPIYSACVYTTTVKTIIHLLKFSHKKQASLVLAQLLFEYFKKLKLNNDFIIVYPGSFYLTKWMRGYEHMYLVAKEFSKLSGLKFYKSAILKVKNITPQYKAKNRRKNVLGAYQINKKIINKIKDKPILLIDDIITTGATIEEVINTLKKEGVSNITCITISKAIKM